MKREFIFMISLFSVLLFSACGYNDVMESMKGDGNPPATLTISPTHNSLNISRFPNITLIFSEAVVLDNNWVVKINNDVYDKNSLNTQWFGCVLIIQTKSAFPKGSSVVVSTSNFITLKNDAPVSDESITFCVDNNVYDAYDEIDGGNESSGSASDLGTLNYVSNTSNIVSGCISGTDKDFYRITITDPIIGNYNILGTKNFHVSIRFLSNPENAYGIKIWQGRVNGSSDFTPGPNLAVNSANCVSNNPSQITQDNLVVLEDGSGVGDILGSFDWGLKWISQSPTPLDNVAGTFSSTYIIEVVQHEEIVGENHNYQIEIGNGLYTVFL
jgi:hypothetical protein